MTTLPKFEQLRDALDWESGVLQGWNTLTPDPNETNPMKTILINAWSKFFNDLLASNSAVNLFCDELKQDKIELQKAKENIKSEVEGNIECADVRMAIEKFIEAA